MLVVVFADIAVLIALEKLSVVQNRLQGNSVFWGKPSRG